MTDLLDLSPKRTVPRTTAELEISYPGRETVVIDRVKRFSYSSDILAVGAPCTFDVEAGKRGEMLRAIPMGSTLRLWMRNPFVNGGRRTLKHLGIVTNRRAALNAGEVKVTSHDLGWHLLRGAAPLWRNLRKCVFGDLVDPKSLHTIIDSSVGFPGVRIDDSNLLQRNLKMGAAAVRAQYGQAFDAIYHVQVEPGENHYALITRYAQRFNRLVTVACDGYIQVWNPDYTRDPVYRFVCDDNGHSNVEDAEVVDDIASVYTDVVCVGTVIGAQFATDPHNPNAGLFRGAYHNSDALPFAHLMTFGDNEMWARDNASRNAEWRWKRGIHDSHYVQVKVLDHYHNGQWYEGDQICTAHFPDLAITDSRYYVEQVQCEGSERGDTTTLTLRVPGLLSAYFDPKAPVPTTAPDVARRLRQTGKE